MPTDVTNLDMKSCDFKHAPWNGFVRFALGGAGHSRPVPIRDLASTLKLRGTGNRFSHPDGDTWLGDLTIMPNLSCAGQPRLT
jgi:hypothetical protein